VKRPFGWVESWCFIAGVWLFAALIYMGKVTGVLLW
jgi:hypothetical protein